MSLEQCTFLLDTVEDCLPTSFLATDQLSLLSGIPMPAKSSENEQQTDGFPACTCGREMSDCSIHPSTLEKWTAFMRDSLARTLASLESRQAYLREPDQVFTAKSCASLAWYDPSSSSWKTYQQSLVTDWEQYSETWPRWGMTAGGSAYAHPMSKRRITETDGLLFATPNTMDSLPPKSEKALHREMTVTRPGRSQPSNLRDQVTQMRNWFPTPTTVDAGTGRFNTSVGSSNARPTLAMMAKKDMWPTPNASDSRDRGNMSNPAIQRRAAIGKQLNLSMVVHPTSGKLSPDWVEWLMNFPIGFTATHDIMGFTSKDRNHAKTKSRNTNSTLPALPEITREKEIQRTAGRFNGIQKEEVLQSGVHGRVHDSGNRDIGRSEESFHEVSSEEMQRLWGAGEFTRSSHGQQSSEQRTRQLEDTLRLMPCEMALGTREEPNEASEGLPVLRQASEEERAMQHPCESDVSARESVNGSWWDTEPNIGRVANGVEHRVHRLKGLGNAQVPLQAAAAYRLLGGE